MKKIALALAFVASAFGTAAQADTVTFSGFAHPQAQTVTVTVPNASTPGSLTQNVYAGGFLTSLNGGPSFTSYCVDLYQHISFNTPYTDYTPAPGHVFANSNAYADLSRLYALAGATINSAVLEAAFQIAVWEIAYETSGTYSLSGGVASFANGSTQAFDTATTWLGQLANANPGLGFGILDSTGHQDVIFAPVPEPSTVVLMLSGLAGVAALARRRQKAAAAA